jgi:hypothetical protein
MAFRYMTGTTCGNGQVNTFIADDAGVSANDFFQLDSGLCVQITAIGSGTTDVNGLVYLVKEYASCAACLAPISANTAQSISVYLNSSINNGSTTATTFNPPNPVWTNNQNHAVSQLNMVTLGGNGLNS